MANLYKFMGADVADKLMLDESHIGIKFSHLQDYNDPYEFFLTIDYNRSPEELAFYSEMIGMVLKQPATCFAKSPIITPMWAHYAGNSSGFVIEIDEDKLAAHIEEMGHSGSTTFSDVQYQDEPDDIEELLSRAFILGKPRYIYFLQSYIRRAAYLRKQTCWSYEQERRVITSEDALIKVNDWLMLLPVPISCIKSLIVGKNADKKLKDSIRELANKCSTKYLEMVFGRSSTSPFMLKDGIETHVFNEGEIVTPPFYCRKCKEPVRHEAKMCAWCSITEVHKQRAAHSNSFRMLEDAGILQEYLTRMQNIGRR